MSAAAGGATALGGRALAATAPGTGTVTMPFENGVRQLAMYPQKRPLIVLTTRPVQLETPFPVFDEDAFTPNDAFFVRWHLADVPTAVDEAVFRLRVTGNVERELALSLSDLRALDQVEVAAVCECSGNSRGFVTPRVPGGQWANGAMGNARWKGPRLRDVLDKAGVRAGSVQIRFGGADGPVLPATPAFRKALDLDVARGDDIVLAYEMNGAPLPLLNGYPLRLVVPGYFATYWVKMLDAIEVLTKTDDNFWMKTAYRIPATSDGGVTPGATGFATKPIAKLTVRSFITSVANGADVSPGLQLVRGIAFDGGSGIASVDFSSDDGVTWQRALLGKDYGRYSFRRWTASYHAARGTRYTLLCRATSASGDTQVAKAVWNPPGYLRSAIERVEVQA